MKLIYRIRQGFRSEICVALYHNSNVPKNWPTFLEALVHKEALIYLEHKATSHAIKPSSYNNEKQADKLTNNNHSYGSSHKCQGTNVWGNTQGQFQGRRRCRSLGNHRKGKAANNGRSTNGVNSTHPSNLIDHSKDNCFTCGKADYLINKCLDPTLKN